MERTKQILTVLILTLVLAGGLILHLALPDQAVSKAERRKLAQFPENLTADSLEEYLLDQFPGRDGLRTIKAVWTYDILRQKDNNGVFIHDGSVSKLDGTLDEKQVGLFTEKFTKLHEKLFPDSAVWYAVVPDKNYTLTQETDYPRMDYDALLQSVQDGLSWAQYCDLTDALDWHSYYATDSHWRQELLQPVVSRLAAAMNVDLPDLDTYRQTTLPGFYGVYYGQAALPMAAEKLTYLENEVTDRAVVTGPELDGEQHVYAPEKFQDMDGYDVFLHGAQAVLTVENPLAQTDRELIIFRDSFGSSLTPLLLAGYKTVTLVDIRYVRSDYLDQFVDFHGQDVLILYSTTLINGASVLR